MKKILLPALVLGALSFASAQNYFGIHADNFGGLNAVSYNPANISGSNFRSEINLASASFSGTNDYYSTDLSNALKGDFEGSGELSPKTNNNFNVSGEVLLPSFMFNLSPKHSVGVITKLRTIINVQEINGGLFDAIDDDFNQSSSFEFEEDKFNINSHIWGEIGLAYGTKLFENDYHTIKTGVNLKYLIGAGFSNISGDNILIDFDGADPNTLSDGQITTQGEIGYTSSFDFTDENASQELGQGAGFGADIGFVYEYRPEKAVAKLTPFANYKLKFGLSITDIGSISYKDAVSRRYNITNSVSELQYETSGEDFEDKLDNLYTLVRNSKGATIKLPTALHLNVDYNINSKFFVNVQTDLSLRKHNQENTNTIANVFSISPRYERKWFSAYMPLSVIEYSGFNAGLGLRAGPIFIGSTTILTNLMTKESSALNIFAGVKIPIYKKGTSRLNESESNQ